MSTGKPTGLYAKDTEVPAEKSRQEMERTLTRYGATGFMYGWEQQEPYGTDTALVAFKLRGMQFRIVVPLPALEDFKTDGAGRGRTKAAQEAAHAKALRQRWRAMALVVKAKLECVESGITTLEQEFMAHIVLPNGETVARWLAPQIDAAYLTGQMPHLLPERATVRTEG